MVFTESEDETDDEQELKHIGNIKKNSGLALCFFVEKGQGGTEGRKYIIFWIVFPFLLTQEHQWFYWKPIRMKQMMNKN